jgi:hypothetical protein
MAGMPFRGFVPVLGVHAAPPRAAGGGEAAARAIPTLQLVRQASLRRVPASRRIIARTADALQQSLAAAAIEHKESPMA